ncbi:uncharacterized phosphotransferase YvkC-like [Panulirus ornatus]|uniref:uncharacterized phosphotransferase YvkC-like n=1 Tax=Panulirus ornatus TaxID=150431 RepID=UPI003A83D6FB
MMWQEAAYLLATLLLARIAHLVFFQRSGPLYWWRWARLVLEVWLERLSRRADINNYSFSDDCTSELCGIVPTAYEKELELPKPLTTDRHGDRMMLCAVDRHGRAVVARVVRQTHRRASVFMCVVDQTGDVYTLPNQPDTGQVNVSEEGWQGAGLTLTCVDPMKCWRVKFNGLLRRGAREQYTTDEGDVEEDESIVCHVRLDLLWHAMKCPVDFWSEVNPRLLAHSLAQDPNTSLQAFLCETGEGYEQWGSLHGMVSLAPGTEPQLWYLRGSRQHRWGLSTCPDLGQESLIYFNNGDVCSLHGHTFSSTQYVSGYVQEAAGTFRPVTWTDLSLQSRNGLPDLGNNLLIKLTGGGQTYEIWQQLAPGVTFYTGDHWNLRHSVHLTTAAASHSYGWGITIFSNRYAELCPVPEWESLPVVEVPRVVLNEEAPLLVTLDNPLCRNSELTGGKGASLALLAAYKHFLHPSQEQYEVPWGLVLTSGAWIHQMQSSYQLQQAVRAVRQAVGTAHTTQLKDACARAVEVCQSVPVCAAVAEALRQEFNHHHLDPESCRLAVRSSGCMEDGEETSAAGQNLTVLGVCGHTHLLHAVTKCWASMFSFHSVEYRRQHGQEVDVGMGVVVQEMVEAKVAGVMFSVDPVTGNPANITITANYGLGESVVSAAVDPDTLVVRRSWQDRLTLDSTTLGSKMTKCVMQEDGGTVEMQVDVEERSHQCLSDAMALHLAHLAIYLQNAFTSPRDVEFAISQDMVYLLQARPITSLHAWTDYEIIHEQDSAVLTDHELSTRANTGEVFPGSATPLTMSIVIPALDLSFQRDIYAFTWNSIRPDPHHVVLCSIYQSHVFLNMLEMQYRYTHTGNSPLHQAIDLQVYGHEVSIPQFIQWGCERFGKTSGLTNFLNMAHLVYDMLTIYGQLRRCKNKFSQYDLGEFRAVFATSLYAEITSRLPHLLQVTKIHTISSKCSSFFQSMMLIVLADGKQEITAENKSDMAMLMMCSDAESADVPSYLKVISQLMAESEEVEEFLAMTPDEGHVWLQSHPGAVGNAFRDFLYKHGHRCIKEFDLSSLSWGLDPRSLVHTLQMMVHHPITYSTNKEHLNVEQTLNALQSPVSHNTRYIKILLILPTSLVWHCYRKLGELLVGEARLPSPELIFYLKHTELGQLIASPSPMLIAKAVQRRRLHCHLDQIKFPEISIGVPKPIIPGKEPEAVDADSVEVIVGTPVCQGVVTAPVKVIINLQDAPSIQNGDVLVTFSTDVGWSPYFPLLAGIVTEIGGLISHGAVVAREYGLPCVVGVTAATQILKTGETIELNATKGTITRLNFHPVDDP